MREPTCTRANDPGTSGSTLVPVDTSRPSGSSGHFPAFPWQGSPWLAHGSPLHGDWFPDPTGLLLRAFCQLSLCFIRHPEMSRSPLLHPVTGPIPSSRAFPFSRGCGAALATLFSPSRPLIRSLVPCLYPTGPPATQWRRPTGSSSIRGLFCAPCTGRCYPIPLSRVHGVFP